MLVILWARLFLFIIHDRCVPINVSSTLVTACSGTFLGRLHSLFRLNVGHSITTSVLLMWLCSWNAVRRRIVWILEGHTGVLGLCCVVFHGGRLLACWSVVGIIDTGPLFGIISHFTVQFHATPLHTLSWIQILCSHSALYLWTSGIKTSNATKLTWSRTVELFYHRLQWNPPLWYVVKIAVINLPLFLHSPSQQSSWYWSEIVCDEGRSYEGIHPTPITLIVADKPIFW
jgi:hypothetical protein